MRHVISILLQNEVGALARVASLFSTRGYNIESLSVAPTEDSDVSIRLQNSRKNQVLSIPRPFDIESKVFADRDFQILLLIA